MFYKVFALFKECFIRKLHDEHDPDTDSTTDTGSFKSTDDIDTRVYGVCPRCYNQICRIEKERCTKCKEDMRRCGFN